MFETEQTYVFKNLTHGIVYSVLVSSVDNAGNISPVTCSPYTEIDLYAPGFTLQDPTASAGYSRVLNPEIHFSNDSTASFWCITSDLDFRPTSQAEACPGGAGSSNGWYTTRPTHLSLAAGDGLKTFHLWAFRSDGTKLSNNITSAVIVLDRTLPSAFTVAGIRSANEDVLMDAWLTSHELPLVKWNASATAVKYSIQILNSASEIVCEKYGLAGSESEYNFVPSECATLSDGQTYRVLMTSFDVAGNSTAAPEFSFTVDTIPPGSFTIAGVDGGPDDVVDGFLGLTSPTIHFTSSSGSTRYEIDIRNNAGVSSCSIGSKDAPTVFFDYGTDSAVPCILLDGDTYRVYITALDAGSNKTSAANNGYLFRVDGQNPTVSITSTPIALTLSTTANFSFSANDSLSGIKETLCSLDGGAFAHCTSPVAFNNLTEGVHTFRVRAIDMVGNFSETSESFTVDLTAPVLAIHTAPPAATNNSAVEFTFSATDFSGVTRETCV